MSDSQALEDAKARVEAYQDTYTQAQVKLAQVQASVGLSPTGDTAKALLASAEAEVTSARTKLENAHAEVAALSDPAVTASTAQDATTQQTAIATADNAVSTGTTTVTAGADASTIATEVAQTSSPTSSTSTDTTTSSTISGSAQTVTAAIAASDLSSAKQACQASASLALDNLTTANAIADSTQATADKAEQDLATASATATSADQTAATSLAAAKAAVTDASYKDEAETQAQNAATTAESNAVQAETQAQNAAQGLKTAQSNLDAVTPTGDTTAIATAQSAVQEAQNANEEAQSNLTAANQASDEADNNALIASSVAANAHTVADAAVTTSTNDDATAALAKTALDNAEDSNTSAQTVAFEASQSAASAQTNFVNAQIAVNDPTNTTATNAVATYSDAQVASTTASLDTAKTDLANAQTNLDITTDKVALGEATQDDVDNAKAKVATAQSDVDQAQTASDAAKDAQAAADTAFTDSSIAKQSSTKAADVADQTATIAASTAVTASTTSTGDITATTATATPAEAVAPTSVTRNPAYQYFFSETYQQLPKLRLAPDLLVYINRSRTFRTWTGDVFDLNDWLVSANGGSGMDRTHSCTLTFYLPRHLETYFVGLAGRFIIRPFYECEIYAKGRFLVDGSSDGYASEAENFGQVLNQNDPEYPTSRYYRIFWGFVSSIQSEWQDGDYQIIINCSPALRLFELTHLRNNNTVMGAVDNVNDITPYANPGFQGNPIQIILDTFSKEVSVSTEFNATSPGGNTKVSDDDLNNSNTANQTNSPFVNLANRTLMVWKERMVELQKRSTFFGLGYKNSKTGETNEITMDFEANAKMQQKLAASQVTSNQSGVSQRQQRLDNINATIKTDTATKDSLTKSISNDQLLLDTGGENGTPMKSSNSTYAATQSRIESNNTKLATISSTIVSNQAKADALTKEISDLSTVSSANATTQTSGTSTPVSDSEPSVAAQPLNLYDILSVVAQGKAKADPKTKGQTNLTSPATDNQPPLPSETSKTSDVKYSLYLQDWAITNYTPYFSFGNFTLFNLNENKKRLDVLVEICESIGYEFYQDLNGNIVFKPPFYNMDTRSDAVFNINDIDIISEQLIEDEARISVTNMAVTGAWTSVLDASTDTNLKPQSQWIDLRLVSKYGQRFKTIHMPMLRGPQATFIYAIACMAKENRFVSQLNIQIPARPELMLGFPIYIQGRDCFGYLERVQWSYSAGNDFTFSLSLSTIRRRIYINKTRLAELKTRNKPSGAKKDSSGTSSTQSKAEKSKTAKQSTSAPGATPAATGTLAVFEQAYAYSMGNEGGLSMVPQDAGNWTGGKVKSGTLMGTNYGISAPVAIANGYTRDMASIPLTLVKSIYQKDYWSPSPNLGNIHNQNIASKIFDMRLAGLGYAKTMVGNACNAVGSKQTTDYDTIISTYGEHAFMQELCNAQASFFAGKAKLSYNSIFAKGWATRASRSPSGTYDTSAASATATEDAYTYTLHADTGSVTTRASQVWSSTIFDMVPLPNGIIQIFTPDAKDSKKAEYQVKNKTPDSSSTKTAVATATTASNTAQDNLKTVEAEYNKTKADNDAKIAELTAERLTYQDELGTFGPTPYDFQNDPDYATIVNQLNQDRANFNAAKEAWESMTDAASKAAARPKAQEYADAVNSDLTSAHAACDAKLLTFIDPLTTEIDNLKDATDAAKAQLTTAQEASKKAQSNLSNAQTTDVEVSTGQAGVYSDDVNNGSGGNEIDDILDSDPDSQIFAFGSDTFKSPNTGQVNADLANNLGITQKSLDAASFFRPNTYSPYRIALDDRFMGLIQPAPPSTITDNGTSASQTSTSHSQREIAASMAQGTADTANASLVNANNKVNDINTDIAQVSGTITKDQNLITDLNPKITYFTPVVASFKQVISDSGEGRSVFSLADLIALLPAQEYQACLNGIIGETYLPANTYNNIADPIDLDLQYTYFINLITAGYNYYSALLTDYQSQLASAQASLTSSQTKLEADKADLVDAQALVERIQGVATSATKRANSFNSVGNAATKDSTGNALAQISLDEYMHLLMIQQPYTDINGFEQLGGFAWGRSVTVASAASQLRLDATGVKFTSMTPQVMSSKAKSYLTGANSPSKSNTSTDDPTATPQINTVSATTSSSAKKAKTTKKLASN